MSTSRSSGRFGGHANDEHPAEATPLIGRTLEAIYPTPQTKRASRSKRLQIRKQLESDEDDEEDVDLVKATPSVKHTSEASRPTPRTTRPISRRIKQRASLDSDDDDESVQKLDTRAASRALRELDNNKGIGKHPAKSTSSAKRAAENGYSTPSIKRPRRSGGSGQVKPVEHNEHAEKDTVQEIPPVPLTCEDIEAEECPVEFETDLAAILAGDESEEFKQSAADLVSALDNYKAGLQNDDDAADFSHSLADLVEEDDADVEDDEADDDTRGGAPASFVPPLYLRAPDPFSMQDLQDDAGVHVERFEQKLLRAINIIKDVTRGVSYLELKTMEEFKMHPSAYLLLAHTSPSWLAEFYLGHIPRRVQELLGNPNITKQDLLDNLPIFPAYDSRMACYVDLAINQTTGVMKQYVGSATSSPIRSSDGRRAAGGWERMRTYLHQATMNFNDLREQGAHQEWICNKDVEMKLFALALFDWDLKVRPFVMLLEAIFMVFFDSIRRTGNPGIYYPKPAMELVDKIHSDCDMHDFRGDKCGLNRAWSASQPIRGVAKLRRDGPTECHWCERVFPIEHKMVKAIAYNPLSGWSCGSCSYRQRQVKLFRAMMAMDLATAIKAFPIQFRDLLMSDPETARCANKECKGGYTDKLCLNISVGAMYCDACYRKAQKTGTLEFVRSIRVGPSHSCINCSEAIPGTSNSKRVRCTRCASYLESKGVERPEHRWARNETERRCANSNCPAMVGTSYGGRSIGTVSALRGPDDKLRCSACNEYRFHRKQADDTERPAQLCERPKRLGMGDNFDTVYNCSRCKVKAGYWPARKRDPECQRLVTFMPGDDRPYCIKCIRQLITAASEGREPSEYKKRPSRPTKGIYDCDDCSEKIAFGKATQNENPTLSRGFATAREGSPKLLCARCKKASTARKTKETKVAKRKANNLPPKAEGFHRCKQCRNVAAFGLGFQRQHPGHLKGSQGRNSPDLYCTPCYRKRSSDIGNAKKLARIRAEKAAAKTKATANDEAEDEDLDEDEDHDEDEDLDEDEDHDEDHDEDAS